LLEEFEKNTKDVPRPHEGVQIQYLAKIQATTRWRPENPELIKAMRHFDHTVNITWVMQHLNVAIKYIEHSGKALEATGGSDWKNTCKIPAKDIFSRVMER
jgi:tryptophan 2,3-dioxygenase